MLTRYAPDQQLLTPRSLSSRSSSAQLLAALKWRKEYNPLAAKEEVFSKTKFGGLGYVTKVKGAKLGVQDSINKEDVVVFNIYGSAAKNSKETFGDTNA
jgi:hypothetical protein